MKPIEPVTLDEIRAARDRAAGAAVRTPLVRLNIDDAPAEIYLKLENLQPIGSFKLRGAANAMRLVPESQLEGGVWTVSSGNMAQGVAWCARQMGVPCSVVVDDGAPEAKLAAIARLGARIVKLPFAEWFEVVRTGTREEMDGLFIHPVFDSGVMAGHGVIALEVLEYLPDVDAVVIPYGGGGLSCGMAVALRELRPEAKVFASEVETGTPFASSLDAGRPVEVDLTPSFVTGIGGTPMLEPMWPMTSSLLDGSLVASVEEIAAAIRLMAERNNIVAEGAGATPVAAALAGKAGSGKVVCVVSGGNIDAAKLAVILQGSIP